jgi:heme-degrading monooxygenase HmoA
MIVRIWSARTSADPDAYEGEFRTRVLDALSGLDGFRGAYLLRRAYATGTEFVTLTLFDSLDDVRRFAGPDVDAANVSPAAREVLDDVDERVRHYTVVTGP